MVSARDALRHTPAGVALVAFTVTHASRQSEAGAERQVELEIGCIAVEALARTVSAAPLGVAIEVTGFLARKGKSSRALVLHATNVEFVEGAAHASTQQG